MGRCFISLMRIVFFNCCLCQGTHDGSQLVCVQRSGQLSAPPGLQSLVAAASELLNVAPWWWLKLSCCSFVFSRMSSVAKGSLHPKMSRWLNSVKDTLLRWFENIHLHWKDHTNDKNDSLGTKPRFFNMSFHPTCFLGPVYKHISFFFFLLRH